jgi:hypothetical protein
LDQKELNCRRRPPRCTDPPVLGLKDDGRLGSFSSDGRLIWLSLRNRRRCEAAASPSWPKCAAASSSQSTAPNNVGCINDEMYHLVAFCLFAATRPPYTESFWRSIALLLPIQLNKRRALLFTRVDRVLREQRAPNEHTVHHRRRTRGRLPLALAIQREVRETRYDHIGTQWRVGCEWWPRNAFSSRPSSRRSGPSYLTRLSSRPPCRTRHHSFPTRNSLYNAFRNARGPRSARKRSSAP